MPAHVRLLIVSFSLVLFGASTPASAQSTKPGIRFAVGETWAAPYAYFDAGHLKGGILRDIADALGRLTQRNIVEVRLPRKRLEPAAAEGELDIHCYFNPAWSDVPDSYQWSKPLFDIPDVLVAHKDVPRPDNINALPAKAVIGTVIGYYYPKLEPLFSTGRLLREDAVDQEKVLLKVAAGRNQFGISNLRAVDWYRRNVPRSGLANWQITVAQADFYCAIPRQGAIPAAELLNALDQLVKSGQMRNILARYR